MYESYNGKKKQNHKDSSTKTEYNKVSLQSQVYTPLWVVKFLVENSLGKLYLEMFPTSKIKNRYKIANVPDKQKAKPKRLEEIKIIDPACGSGNFLLYAFEFLYELYLDQIENFGADYSQESLPSLIIENNLYGIDLDDRAVQLAQLGLFVKAKKKLRAIGEIKFNLVSSDFFLPEYDDVKQIFLQERNLDENQQNLLAETWNELQMAYKFGSLIRLGETLKLRIHELQREVDSGKYSLFTHAAIEKEKNFAAAFFANIKTAVEHYSKEEEGISFLTGKTRDAITFLQLLTTEFDVAVTNPPYTDSADFGPELKEFIECNYKKPFKFHTNLYASFIKRCYEMTAPDGKIAMIHPRTFMFIKSFEDVRKFILDKTSINVFIDYSLSNLFGSIMVDPAFYVLEKSISKDQEAWFVSLDQYTRTPNEKFKKDFCLQALEDYISGVANEHNYLIPQSKLKVIKSWPFIYWISDEFREKFRAILLEEVFSPKAGLQTGDNNRFLRFWWEVVPDSRAYESQDKWILHSKGGPFCKWYGNLWLTVNWENNGHEIKTFTDDKGKVRSRPQNEAFYLKEGVTFSRSGTKGASFRYLPAGHMFDSGGCAIFPVQTYKNIYYCLAFVNSKIASYLTGCLNPTVNTQIGDIERIPFVKPMAEVEAIVSNLSKTNVSIKKCLSGYSLVELNFKGSPYKGEDTITKFLNYENHLVAQVLINEAIVNELIFDVYQLSDSDRKMVLTKEGEMIGALPVLAEAREAYLAETEATNDFSLDKVREFIERLPTMHFTLEEQESVVSQFPTLYQNNNDLEEFCVRNSINPINIWYWFKQSKLIPPQRKHTIAMEFLANLIREILLEDEDGIIPLVPNAGEKILLERIEEKFRSNGFSPAQYSHFDSLLGRPLHEHLSKHFFTELSDLLNLFMYLSKTPFIWHISSGPEQGFDCFIIIYKWTRDKLMRLRSVYIEHRERSLVNRQTDLSSNDSAEAQNEKDRIIKQLNEIEVLKHNIDALLAEGYNPKLDDGVGKNIAPLQKKKMIPYNVLSKEQMNKYLHADW